MVPLQVGSKADGTMLSLSPEARGRTHMHVIGGSGKGKSKFLESLIRQDIAVGKGICVIDWHGELYNNLLRWFYWKDVGLFGDRRRIILLNPSQPDHVSVFNPFYKHDRSDHALISADAERLIGVTLRAWGENNSDQTPTLERMLRALFVFMLETGETLPNAAKLLDFEERALRDYAIRTVKDQRARSIWRDLQRHKSYNSEWKGDTLSTINRLARFIGSAAVNRFMGLARSDVDITRIIDERAILIVNLGESSYLAREPAKLFASLLLREFFTVFMSRANVLSHEGRKPQPFNLYLDEFQEYINDDMAAMLDAVRKSGLHMVLAHQHLGHFWDSPKLKKSVFTNARNRVVFGGLDYEDASIFANELFLRELNTRQVKQAYYSHYTVHEEETRVQRSATLSESLNWSKSRSSSSAAGSGTSSGSGESASSSEGGDGTDLVLAAWLTQMAGTTSFDAQSSYEMKAHGEASAEGGARSKSSGETVVPFLKPVLKEQLSNETEWSREEKVSKMVEMLSYQAERHCFVRLDTEATQTVCVPLLKSPFVREETLAEYQKTIYKQQGSLPAAEVDRLLIESERQFVARASGTRELLPKPPTAENDAEFLE